MFEDLPHARELMLFTFRSLKREKVKRIAILSVIWPLLLIPLNGFICGSGRVLLCGDSLDESVSPFLSTALHVPV